MHVLNKKSCKYFARAVAMSGFTSSIFAHYDPNNQLELMYDTFKTELQNIRNPVALLHFMKTAPVELILQKTPAISLNYLISISFWAPVIEG